jgi:hypothetical protein
MDEEIVPSSGARWGGRILPLSSAASRSLGHLSLPCGPREERLEEGMRQETDSRVEAVERLDAARERRVWCSERYDSERGSPNELDTSVALEAAQEQFAAREAWLAWIDRDY